MIVVSKCRSIDFLTNANGQWPRIVRSWDEMGDQMLALRMTEMKYMKKV